jgi:predicted lysophospholipase L1 biosynthesis ABC-type transport system permease subunit
LLTSIRRRRHELAILKSLGLGRRGVSATVAWQASTLVGLALLVGLPLGVVVGLRVWSAFAGGLGIASDARTPWLALALAVPAALLIANAIAAIPGYLAGRTPPGEVLRAE